MSSESVVRIHTADSARFPGEGSSSQGKSGPKVWPKGVADGQQVDIPAPPQYDKDLMRGHRRIVQPWGWKAVVVTQGPRVVKYALSSG